MESLLRMFESSWNPAALAASVNVLVASAVIIIAFSLFAFTLTYNFRSSAARRFALVLACIIITYTGDVALNRVDSAASANRWLRFQWLGIAMLPYAYHLFSTAVLRTTNYKVRTEHYVSMAMFVLSALSAVSAILGTQIVDRLYFRPPLSHLEAGPYFWLFGLYFAAAVVLSLFNIWKARQRCLTERTRNRMTYLLLGFAVPGVGIFPFLIGLSRLSMEQQPSLVIFATATLGNIVVGIFLVLMSYVVAYLGVLTPDRVVRYRLIRFFTRGPMVAILVILAIQTVPPVERVLGLPRDLVLFSTITGVIVLSQLALSVTKTLVNRLVYREDSDEISWLTELDRRLLTTSDMRQFLENNLAALCELLRVPSGFVAAIVGPDIILEALVGTEELRNQVTESQEWPEAVNAVVGRSRNGSTSLHPVVHKGFWIWPLVEMPGSNGKEQVLGILGAAIPGSLAEDGATENGIAPADAAFPHLSPDEQATLQRVIDRIARALVDRRVQQEVFVTLRRIIPDIEHIQRLRGMVPYMLEENNGERAAELLAPSPIHDPEFDAWVKDALSHYWGGPKLTRSPLQQMRIVDKTLEKADGDPTKALRLVLGSAIDRLKPEGKQDFNTPEWLLYNILEMRFIQGRKVREIANRLAVSESDLYRKQRVAIGQVARVISEMEQENGKEAESV